MGLVEVPGPLTWDNEAGIRRGRKRMIGTRAPRPLAMPVVLLMAFDPGNGIVERVAGYLETSILSGHSLACPLTFESKWGR